MKLMLRSLAAAAAFLSVGALGHAAANEPASPPAADPMLSVPAPEDTVAFVQGVYARKQEIDAMGEGEWEANVALINDTFSPELLAIFNAFLSTPEPVLDGDVFWGAQDWEITELAFAFTGTAEATTVTASFRNFGEPRLTILTLVLLDGNWKIDNIGWEDGYDLRRMFREDVEGAAPETPPAP
ncbi:MAG TPA: hypothetical protein PL096_11330 [Micropepsaceae bacterium]|nr:hypothetical protein [Micropepsaceae bacterium]